MRGKIHLYFYRDYIMLYIDHFLYNFVNSIYQVFTPIILYQAGLTISLILFIYAIQFFLMGVLTPLSGILVKKFGIVGAKMIGYFLKVISLFLVFTIDIGTPYYIFIPIIYGISGAINNPLKTYLYSKIVKDNFRGRFSSFVSILNCISSIMAYIFVVIFLPKNNYMMIIGTSIVLYSISLVALGHLTKSSFYYRFKKPFQESYFYLFKSRENTLFKTVSGLRSFIVIERLIAIPLFLHLTSNNLQTFTIIYIISTLLEIISLIITGRKLDHNINMFNKICSIKGFISFVFLVVKEKIVILFNQSLYKLSDHVYESSYSALLQSKVKNDSKNTFILSLVHEMSLCFYEFMVLVLLSFVAMANGMVALNTIFLCSIFVVVVSYQIVKSWRVIE